MARDAIIVLQNLECISQHDSALDVGEDPYIWPVLMWLDSTSLDGTLPLLGESRLILKAGMRPGDIAAIPYPLGTLGHRFEDDSSINYLMLAVLVWAQQKQVDRPSGTPDAAIWAGCKAFSSALPAAVSANFNGLADPTSRQQTIEIIKQSVGNIVRSAISDALPLELKFAISLGAYQLDFLIGSDFYVSSDLTEADFTLSMSAASGDNYAVHGGLRVHVPAVDVCQAQVDQVTAKQKNVDEFNGQISQLKGQMQTAPPADKPYIAAQIMQANNDLVVANQDLADARAALKTCRDHWAEVVGAIPTSPGTPIFTAS